MDVNEIYLPEKETRLASSVAAEHHGTAGLPVSFSLVAEIARHVSGKKKNEKFLSLRKRMPCVCTC